MQRNLAATAQSLRGIVAGRGLNKEFIAFQVVLSIAMGTVGEDSLLCHTSFKSESTTHQVLHNLTPS